MATATLVQPPSPPPPPKEVRLDMSMEEAQTLRDMLARVGGSPSTTRRAHAKAIANALLHVGIFGTERADLSGRMQFDEMQAADPRIEGCEKAEPAPVTRGFRLGDHY